MGWGVKPGLGGHGWPLMTLQIQCCLARAGKWGAFCAEGTVHANDQSQEVLLAPRHRPSDEGSLNNKEVDWPPQPEALLIVMLSGH